MSLPGQFARPRARCQASIAGIRYDRGVRTRSRIGGPMHPEDARRFAANYTPADERSIRFAWNGEHSEEFEDANHDFRQEVLAVALEDLGAFPIELVRDLYRAETEF